ncbi:integrase [Mycobacteroides abscessus subsp. massiliense]|uniref:site-specific integrase n=1 Tax=Mycobacteroides abscessus TaxID=36809 RepID=UPI0009A5B0DC|nr:site-specific integrase [Mycobacteroides abscessus]SKT57073.1 integrase [Mycobacteroides abscessus subsp. massiliense]
MGEVDIAAQMHAALTPDVALRIAQATSSSRSAGTHRAYDSAWRRFDAWCHRSGHQSLPANPAVIAAYLVDAADTRDSDGQRSYAPATLTKWIAAITDRHRRSGHTAIPTGHELVRATLSGIRREYAAAGDRPRVVRAPLLTDDIVTLVTAANDQVSGWSDAVYARRDCALLLIGFAAALRRSELVAFSSGDVALHALDGLHLTVRQSKTDQEGIGSVHAIPRSEAADRCAPCAFHRWAHVVSAFDHDGRRGVIKLLSADTRFDEHVCLSVTSPTLHPGRPLFRSICRNGNLSSTAMSGASVHAVIRRRAIRAGFSPAAVESLGGHSLRAGFVTQAFRNGSDAHAIMRQTRHRTPAMVERYAREEAPLIGNAVTSLGL